MRKVEFLCGLFLTTGILLADFTETRIVGPGITHTHQYLSQGPWHIQVLEIELDNPSVRLETIKAADRLAGYERTSQMAARSDGEAHRVVGAINGDFYGSGGIPVGAQVVNGEMLKREYTRSTFGVGPDNQPFIEIVTYAGRVTKGGQELAPIHDVNGIRDQDECIIYNHYKGERTGTNQWGTELICEWIDSPMVNAPLRARVTAKDSSMAGDSGNNLIPTGGFVLSAHGQSKAALDSTLFQGDTFRVDLQFAPVPHEIEQLIGGTPRLIRDGFVSVEWQEEGVGSSFTHDRHPRTALGFDADSTTLFLFTVDGRQAGFSLGMSLFELANYMLDWGVYQGVNLDGGGSTTMVVRGQIVNSPSDAGGERSVGNALLVIDTAPTGPLAHLEALPQTFYTLVNTSQQMEVLGFDSTYNPVDVPVDSLVWSCDPTVGSIDAAGLFTAGMVPGFGWIAVQQDGLTDTARVTVTQVDSIRLLPDPVVLETGQVQQMQATAYDALGNVLNLQNSDYAWWVTPGIGTINNIGLFSAYQYGSGMIRVSYGQSSDSVTVAVGSSQNVTLDDFTSVDQWSVSGLLVDLANCAFEVDSTQYISVPSSGRLDYSLTTGGTSVLYLNTQIPISGTPDKVFLDIFGDGSGHWIRGEFQNAGGDRFLVNFTAADPGIDWDGSWRTVQVPLAEATAHWGNPGAILSFPITWTKLYLAEPDDAHKDAGSIWLDNFGVSYLTTDLENPLVQPTSFQLDGPYPNPFNAETLFRFEIPDSGVLRLRIFNLQGQEMADLQQSVTPGHATMQWDARNTASGLYVFEARIGSDYLRGKCLLLK